eukprot:XP_001710234.1 Hypothetical protein GL50803_93362 [Giardia lamblia ATCC 50803]
MLRSTLHPHEVQGDGYAQLHDWSAQNCRSTKKSGIWRRCHKPMKDTKDSDNLLCKRSAQLVNYAAIWFDLAVHCHAIIQSK